MADIVPSDLPTVPGDTTCAHCDGEIERGYVTVTVAESDVSVDTTGAVCDTCGWRDVGATGCAPTLGDFDGGEVLVRIEREGNALAPVDVTDTT